MEKRSTLTSITWEKIALKYPFPGIGYIKSCNNKIGPLLFVTGTIMTYDL